MQLTESWKDAFDDDVVARYDFAETRNASAIMKSTSPAAFRDMQEVLRAFILTVDMITTPGGNKSVIAAQLDDAFRVRGWREARFDQVLTTNLTVFRWTDSGDPNESQHVITETNEYGGHKVDNVMGRAVLDVEWNPKDGNLDRDLSNYVSLHEGGVIDVGVIVNRTGDELRELVRETISRAKAVADVEASEEWSERMRKLANDPLGTTTTANFGKLVPRLERGDGRGCPILAIAITSRCFQELDGTVEDEVRRLASDVARLQPSAKETVEQASDSPESD